MKFLAILVGVAVELYVLQIQQVRQFGWFARWSDFLMRNLQRLPMMDGRIGVLVIILPIVFLVLYLDYELGRMIELNKMYSVFGFLFYSAVLIYGLGPQDPIRTVDDYMDCVEHADLRTAQVRAEQVLGQVITEPVAEYAARIKEMLLIRVNDNIVGPIVWFVLIGPIGVVLFRLSCELKERFTGMQGGLALASQELYLIVAWLPARVCAMSYAFAGSFVDTVANWRHVSDLWLADSNTLLIRSGMGSVGDVNEEEDEEISALQSLANVLAMVKRSVLILITLLAVMIIVGLFNG
jgi:membrane protein required for beta-lactamase induction